MHRRIETEGIDEYKRIKNLAKTDSHFLPYLRWFHGEEEKPAEHVIKVQKRITALQGRKKPGGGIYRHQDIADFAGCSKTTVTHIINGKCNVSKEMADDIIRNLNSHRQKQYD